jgi:putative FmdB family regulatory protein
LPTYEYHCPKCNATYELRQGFDAETTQTCEECGKGIAKRVLYAPPVVFKGSGWYVTDSKGKNSATTDSHSDSESSSSSSTSASDDKPKASPKKADAPSSPASSADAAAS